MNFRAYREELARLVIDYVETNYHPIYKRYLRLFEQSHPFYTLLYRFWFPYALTKKIIWRYFV